jgi:outer membrane protein with beta-barrel domain
MRLLSALIVSTIALGGVAHAQTGAPAAAADNGYVEAVGQSAFGNVTSQSFGVEAGFTVASQLQVFVEAGKTRDVATTALGSNAQKIAGELAVTQTNVAFSVKEPVTFAAAGVRYSLFPPGDSKARPYLMAGLGIASVTQEVAFTVAGTDVTSTLSQSPYFIVLGSDLSGSFTKPMFVFGGGVAYPVWKQLLFDFQFRLGRILAEDEAITVGRVGLGIGVRF